MTAKREFGANLPHHGRSYSLEQPELDFGVLKDIALIIEKNRFNSIGVSDHLLNPQGSMPNGTENPERFKYGILESWTLLSSVSTITSKARLTETVLCNLFRYPAVLAKMASTLDVISNGRLNLALGAGWFRAECLAYGVPWKPYKTRLEMLRESVQLIKLLWTEEEVNFTGKHYRIEKGILSPKPVQKPHPPIIVGGISESVLKLVAEEANGWDVDTGMCSLESFKEKLVQLERYCNEVGRDVRSVRLSGSATPLFAKNVAEARKLGAIWARRIGGDPEKFMSNDSVLLGTAEDVVAAADKWFEAGLEHINLLVPYDVAYTQRFCEEVASITRSK